MLATKVRTTPQIRIESDDWLYFSQVTAKSKDGANLSKGKPCTSSGPYKGHKANECGIALDGKEKTRNYTSIINNVGDQYGISTAKRRSVRFGRWTLETPGQTGLDHHP